MLLLLPRLWRLCVRPRAAYKARKERAWRLGRENVRGGYMVNKGWYRLMIVVSDGGLSWFLVVDDGCWAWFMKWSVLVKNGHEWLTVVDAAWWLERDYEQRREMHRTDFFYASWGQSQRSWRDSAWNFQPLPFADFLWNDPTCHNTQQSQTWEDFWPLHVLKKR